MIGLGIKTYRTPSIGNKMYGSPKTLGNKIYGPSRVNNKPNISSHPDTLYHNSHNSNIAYVPFGTKKVHLYEDKLKLHTDLVKKHDGNITRSTHHNEAAPAVIKHKLFK